MSFIEKIKEQAKKDLKTIVLPEASDLRVIKATHTALEENYAKIILVGDTEKINNMAKENNLDISKAIIIDPRTSEKTAKYAEELYELRKAKGMTKLEENIKKR